MQVQCWVADAAASDFGCRGAGIKPSDVRVMLMMLPTLVVGTLESTLGCESDDDDASDLGCRDAGIEPSDARVMMMFPTLVVGTLESNPRMWEWCVDSRNN